MLYVEHFFCARHTGSNILQLRPALLVRLNRENPTLPFLQKNNMISHLKPFAWYTPTPTMDKEYLLTDFLFLNTRNLNNDHLQLKTGKYPFFKHKHTHNVIDKVNAVDLNFSTSVGIFFNWFFF